MSVVFDTNVFISSILWKGSVAQKLSFKLIDCDMPISESLKRSLRDKTAMVAKRGEAKEAYFLYTTLLVFIIALPQGLADIFTPEHQITYVNWNTDGQRTYAKILPDSHGDYFVVWLSNRDNRLMFRKYRNSGEPITEEIVVLNTMQYALPLDALLDRDGNIQVVWGASSSESPVHQLYYVKIDRDGNALMQRQLTNDMIFSSGSRMATDGNNIYVVYYKGDFDIHLMKLDLNGNRVIADKRITNNPLQSTTPAIAVDTNGYVNVVWREDVFSPYHDSDVYYARIAPDFTTVVPNRPLAGDPNYIAIYPSIEADNHGNSYAVWSDNRNVVFGAFYEKIDNRGVSVIDDRPLQNTPGALYPKIAVDSRGHLHMVFISSVTLPTVPYYARFTNDGQVVVDTIAFQSPVSYYTNEADIIIDTSSTYSLDGDIIVFYSRAIVEGVPPYSRVGRNDLFFRTSFTPVEFSIPSTVRPGERVQFAISDPLDPGATAFIGLSFGNERGIPLPDGRRVIPLNMDSLFILSFLMPSLFGFPSLIQLDARGRASGQWSVPATAPTGLTLAAAAIILPQSQQEVLAFSRSQIITISA